MVAPPRPETATDADRSAGATGTGLGRSGAPGDRGPLRPDELITARARQSRRLAAHVFRLVDLISIAAVTIGVVLHQAHSAVRDAPVSVVAPLVAAAMLTARLLRSARLYRFGRHEHLATHVAGMIGAVAVGWAVAAVSGVLLGASDLPVRAASVWAGSVLISLLVLHAVWWILVRRWRATGRLTPNIVIVGATGHAERFIDETLERRDLNVLGVFDDRLARSPTALSGVPVLGDTEALLGHRIVPFIDRIVVAVDPSARARVRQITERLAALPNEVSLVVDDDESTCRSDALKRLADAPLAPLDVVLDPELRAFAKRAQDLTISVVAVVLLAPIMALIALAVRLDSPGPVFFRQRRHGFNNEDILVWKFRSMRDDARDERAEQQVTAGDARVTRVGRFLRKTSLDELPQLFNVLGGQMSLVGPRPHAIGMKTGEVEAAGLVADYAQRHRIKPGMTGWAAVKGSRGPLHSAADVRRRVAFDVEYIERQTFWLDLRIMAMTVPTVLGDRSTIR